MNRIKLIAILFLILAILLMFGYSYNLIDNQNRIEKFCSQYDGYAVGNVIINDKEYVECNFIINGTLVSEWKELKKNEN